MKHTFGILLVIYVLIGCGPWYDDNPTGPSEGPEGQSLDTFRGTDSAGNRIEYEFYLSGTDTVKHGDYTVFFDDADMPDTEGRYSQEISYWIEFRQGERNGWAISYSLQLCVGESKGREVCRDVISKWDRNYYRDGLCVSYNQTVCDGDEYEEF